MSGPDAIVREPLLDAALPGGPAVERVKGARIELGPRQETGLHLHPCHTVGLITVGTIRFQVEGRPERTLHAGDAFHEPADTRMAHFDNASETDHAAFVVFYLLPPGEERLIEILDPAEGRGAPQ